MAFSQDPFERLTSGATYSRALSVMVQRYDLFLVLSTLVYLPLAFMMITMMKLFGSSMGTIVSSMSSVTVNANDFDTAGMNFDYSNNINGNNMEQESSFEYSSSITSNLDMNDDEFDVVGMVLLGNMAKFGVQLVLEYIAFLVIGIAGQAAMSYAVAEMYAGREPYWLDCLKKGFSRWCNLFRTVLLVAGGMMIFNILLQIVVAVCIYTQSVLGVVFAVVFFSAWFVVVIYVTVSLMILVPVIMVEGQGPINSLKRCWELSWNNRCYIYCTIFVLVLILYTVTIVLTVMMFEIGGSGFTSFGAFVCSLPMLLYIPLAVILETVIYLNIRGQMEGLNRDVLASDLYGDTSVGKEINYALIEKGPDV